MTKLRDQFFNLGAELSRYREEKRLTQKDLARELEVTQATISRIEKGEQISPELGLKIQKILNKAVIEFHPKFKVEFETISNWAISYFSFPPRRMGGDRIIIDESSARDKVIIGHCDAVGHGSSASHSADLFSVAFFSALNSIHQNQITPESLYSNIAGTIRKTKELWKGEPGVNLIVLSKDQERVSILNGGMPQGILLRKNARTTEVIPKNQYPSPGAQRNVSPYADFLDLRKGDVLFIGSDGFLDEFKRVTNQDFERVFKGVSLALQGDPEGIALKILRVFGENLRYTLLEDDISFVIVSNTAEAGRWENSGQLKSKI